MAELAGGDAAPGAGDAVQQLLEVAEVTVGEQPQGVEAGDPLRVVQRGAEHARRGTPLVGRRTAPSTARRSAAGGASTGWRWSAAARPAIRSITSVPLSGSAATSRGARTGGRCRTNERYVAISCLIRSARSADWSTKHLATAVVRPLVPTSRTERGLRRSTWTGWNSGQTRCTAATAARNCAPCGPDRSSLPLSCGVPSPATRRVRPEASAVAAGRAGSRYGPLPGGVASLARGGGCRAAVGTGRTRRTMLRT